MKTRRIKWFRVAAAVILLLSLIPDWRATAQQRSKFEIAQLPANLRTDLKGSSIKVVLPENAPDRPWNDALIAKFQKLTGIRVEIVRPGNDTTAVLAKYLRDFQSGSPEGDVYAIDIVWPGILKDYAEDLRTQVGDLQGMLPSLIQNDSVDGKLVAVPYFTEISLLYYRSDLLEKYHFAHPPTTWTELESQARVIQDGQRANGNKQFWGFVWQGAASEALTCNALEWQISEGGGRLLDPDGKVNVKHDRAVLALKRAHAWVGTISPPDVIRQLEDDSLRLWKQGDAAFMRNWPYAYPESMKSDSRVIGRVEVTILPRGEASDGRHADALGGFQLMVSKSSKNKSAAIELVKFLISSEIQKVNATTRGYAPTRADIYNDPSVLKESPPFETLRTVLFEGAVTRPSTAAGSRYDEVSHAYFTAVHQALTGERSEANAATEIEKQVQIIMSH